MCERPVGVNRKLAFCRIGGGCLIRFLPSLAAFANDPEPGMACVVTVGLYGL